MKASQLFEQLLQRQDLSDEQIQALLLAWRQGEWTDTQIAVFLALMRMKGESVAELTAATRQLRDLMHPIQLAAESIDIVGTGGDGQNLFNVSTAACFVVAGAGVPVAKHGNRSVSSRSGSADLLEMAGIRLDLSAAELNACQAASNLAFLFAPHYHPALQSVRPARQQLGIRSFFNLLGPMLNPAQVKRHVIGVFAPQWQRPVAEVLVNLGSQALLVVHAEDGLDEISIAARTPIVEYRHGQWRDWVLDPADWSLQHANLNDLKINSPTESLNLINRVLTGEPGPARDMVLLNAAAAIYCALDALSFDQALQKARESLDSGSALRAYQSLVQMNQQFHKDTPA